MLLIHFPPSVFLVTGTKRSDLRYELANRASAPPLSVLKIRSTHHLGGRGSVYEPTVHKSLDLLIARDNHNVEPRFQVWASVVDNIK